MRRRAAATAVTVACLVLLGCGSSSGSDEISEVQRAADAATQPTSIPTPSPAVATAVPTSDPAPGPLPSATAEPPPPRTLPWAASCTDPTGDLLGDAQGPSSRLAVGDIVSASAVIEGTTLTGEIVLAAPPAPTDGLSSISWGITISPAPNDDGTGWSPAAGLLGASRDFGINGSVLDLPSYTVEFPGNSVRMVVEQVPPEIVDADALYFAAWTWGFAQGEVSDVCGGDWTSFAIEKMTPMTS